jgi:hypothetical protein
MSERSSGTYLIRAFWVWLILIAAEFIHGVVRVLLLAPYIGDFRARQIGAVTGSLIVLAVSYVLAGWIAARTTRALMGVGFIWLGLTVLFEIGLGRLVFRYPWERLLEDYDLSRGGLLVPAFAVMALSPLIASWLRKKRYARHSSAIFRSVRD